MSRLTNIRGINMITSITSMLILLMLSVSYIRAEGHKLAKINIGDEVCHNLATHLFQYGETVQFGSRVTSDSTGQYLEVDNDSKHIDLLLCYLKVLKDVFDKKVVGSYLGSLEGAPETSEVDPIEHGRGGSKLKFDVGAYHRLWYDVKLNDDGSVNIENGGNQDGDVLKSYYNYSLGSNFDLPMVGFLSSTELKFNKERQLVDTSSYDKYLLSEDHDAPISRPADTYDNLVAETRYDVEKPSDKLREEGAEYDLFERSLYKTLAAMHILNTPTFHSGVLELLDEMNENKLLGSYYRSPSRYGITDLLNQLSESSKTVYNSTVGMGSNDNSRGSKYLHSIGYMPINMLKVHNSGKSIKIPISQNMQTSSAIREIKKYIFMHYNLSVTCYHASTLSYEYNKEVVCRIEARDIFNNDPDYTIKAAVLKFSLSQPLDDNGHAAALLCLELNDNPTSEIEGGVGLCHQNNPFNHIIHTLYIYHSLLLGRSGQMILRDNIVEKGG